MLGREEQGGKGRGEGGDAEELRGLYDEHARRIFSANIVALVGLDGVMCEEVAENVLREHSARATGCEDDWMKL